jgi:hypothetical protein
MPITMLRRAGFENLSDVLKIRFRFFVGILGTTTQMLDWSSLGEGKRAFVNAVRRSCGPERLPDHQEWLYAVELVTLQQNLPVLYTQFYGN